MVMALREKAPFDFLKLLLIGITILSVLNGGVLSLWPYDHYASRILAWLI